MKGWGFLQAAHSCDRPWRDHASDLRQLAAPAAARRAGGHGSSRTAPRSVCGPGPAVPVVPAAPLDPGIIVGTGLRAVQSGEGRSVQRAFEHAVAAAGHVFTADRDPRAPGERSEGGIGGQMGRRGEVPACHLSEEAGGNPDLRGPRPARPGGVGPTPGMRWGWGSEGGRRPAARSRRRSQRAAHAGPAAARTDAAAPGQPTPCPAPPRSARRGGGMMSAARRR